MSMFVGVVVGIGFGRAHFMQRRKRHEILESPQVRNQNLTLGLTAPRPPITDARKRSFPRSRQHRTAKMYCVNLCACVRRILWR